MPQMELGCIVPLGLSFPICKCRDNAFLYFFKIILLTYFLAVLGLRCFAQAFSGCSERGATFRCRAWASRCGGCSCRGARALGHAGFSSCCMRTQ